MSRRRGLDVELISSSDHYSLDEVWEKHLKPRLPELAEPLINQTVKHLETQYYELHAWQKAHRDGDPVSWHRSAIEPHEQDEHPKPADVLINVTRDCLEWLAANRPAKAAGWCDRLCGSEVPILRRIGVHLVSERADLTADEKCQWLLTDGDLHDLPCHHEIFRLLSLIYPHLAEVNRLAVLQAIGSFRWPDEEDDRKEERTAYEHFSWLSWVGKSDPNCVIVQKELKKIRELYPNFVTREHPDLTHWISTGWVEPQSPWTVEQLITKPAKQWLPDLLEFKGSGFSGPSIRGMVNTIVDAAKKEFQWGLDLAVALAEGRHWKHELWSGLIQGWSDMDLDEPNHRKILNTLGQDELYREHPREIAQALFAIVKNEGKPGALGLLPLANMVASELWRKLDREPSEEGRDDWLTMAINHAGGILAEFWLNGLSLCRKDQDPKPEKLDEVYAQVFSEIIKDQSLPGKLGRCILASQFAFLLGVDREWTQDNLIPLFVKGNDSSEFQAVWDGFLSWGRLYQNVVEVLKDPFFNAIELLDRDLTKRLDRFVQYYTVVIIVGVEDPLNQWIPKLFAHGGLEARNHFASDIANNLGHMKEEQQKGLWQKWLKRFWEGRLQGVPAALEPSEIEHMISWLPKLSAVFPEAVKLAIQMPQVPLSRFSALYDFRRGDLIERHPAAFAELLVFLGRTGSPAHFWHGLKEIAERLRVAEIPERLRLELEELFARVGLVK